MAAKTLAILLLASLGYGSLLTWLILKIQDSHRSDASATAAQKASPTDPDQRHDRVA